MLASPNDLHYFIELCQTLNFSRASERIGIAQPSLSAAIKRLEHSLKTPLFIRDKRTVILTQAGKNLLSHAKELIQLWNMTKANCLNSQNEIQGNITLGCHPSVALFFLPKFLPTFLKKNLKVEIQLEHDLSRKIAEKIINFTVDIGIVVNPIKHPDLIITKLFNDNVTFWQNHSELSEPVTPDEKILICDPELLQTQWLLKATRKKNLNFKRIVTSSSLEVILNLTAQGTGIGILPERVASSLTSRPLHKVTDMPVYKDEICLVYRHEKRNIKAVQALIELMKTEANRL